MNITNTSTTNTSYINQVKEQNDNDKVRPDNDSDDFKQQQNIKSIQKSMQTTQMEQSVQPNLGKNLNLYA